MSLLPGPVDRIQNEISRFGVVDGIRYWARQAKIRSQRNLTGENVFERDWDVLILLDACRVDELRRVESQFSFLSSIDELESKSTYSPSWMAETFGNTALHTLQETAYITANPFSSDIEAVEDLGYVDHVWEYGTDPSVNVVPPRTVTDRAIQVGRSRSYDRIIIHYMQPHAPFIRETDGGFETILEGDQGSNDYGEGLGVWPAIYAGHVSLDEIVDAYRETLQLVLGEVELLIENLDAPQTVISADHGQLFGEEGLYGHPPDLPVGPLQTVPWVVTESIDKKSHQPATYDQERDEIDRDTRLQALGYK